jgi:hypothetical protein
MLHHIRLAIRTKDGKVGGEVEFDESFIGEKFRNMHRGKRAEDYDTGGADKAKRLRDGLRLPALRSLSTGFVFMEATMPPGWIAAMIVLILTTAADISNSRIFTLQSDACRRAQPSGIRSYVPS